MSFLFDQSYYQVGKNGVSPFQNMHFHRGQGIGIAKAIVSLTLFHEGRIFITNQFKQHNLKKLEP